MATKKSKNVGDAKKARARYVDQPGQIKDVTPASTKKRQAKGWAALEKSVKKGGKK